MDTGQLMERLAARGVELAADGERLRFRPRDAVTPELRAALIEHKAELVRMLRTEEREIGWRVAAMRAQIRTTGPIPFLVARRCATDAPGLCLSCGLPFGEGRRFRCRRCSRAAEIVLNQVREDC